MKEISPLMKVALKVLDTARGQIINGDCVEESVANTLTKLHPAANSEYINPKDYCKCEQAMEMLHLGRNTVRFFKLLKEYDVQVVKINNKPIGYRIKDIERIKKDLIG